MLPPLSSLSLNATGQKGLASGLEALVEALGPFREYDSAALAELLRLASTYRDTGAIPDDLIVEIKGKAAGKAPRKARPPAAPKLSVEAALKICEEVRDRQGDVEPGAISAAVDRLNALTVPQLKDVHQKFLNGVSGKTKADLIAALRKRLGEHHSARERSRGILAR